MPASASSRAGPIPSARSASVVGHRQTPVPPAAEQRDVPCGQVGGVHGRVSGPSTPASASSSVGVHAVGGQAGLVLGRLLGQVDVQRPAPPRRRGHRGQVRRAGTARTEWIAAPTRIVVAAAQRGDPLAPTPSAEPSPNRAARAASGVSIPPVR